MNREPLVGVLGLARSGEAAAHLALQEGMAVYASDASDTSAIRSAAERIRTAGGEAEVGSHDVERLAACREIVLSPGIPLTASILQRPELRGIPVISEVEFAARFLRAPLVAVTGTNGKTTVTALAAHLLQEAGLDAPAGGNIGTALSEVARREESPDAVVVEVSSFQLATIRDFAPAVGVLTNLAPDHLDRYASVEEYYGDKARLFSNATEESRWVLNGEDLRAKELPGDAPGERFYFRVSSRPADGERGGYVSEDGWLVLRLEPGREERLLPTNELQILGPHNIANALAATLAARLLGTETAKLLPGLRSFRAIPHRLQPIGERDGVLWINDSKATNIASTRVALRSMQRPTVLLLGGRHKGEPYTELLDDLRDRARCVIAYGEAAERVEQDLGPHCRVIRVDGSFGEVVHKARQTAEAGDVVLLSPACSSYDMFENYEERGRRFAELADTGAA